VEENIHWPFQNQLNSPKQPTIIFWSQLRSFLGFSLCPYLAFALASIKFYEFFVIDNPKGLAQKVRVLVFMVVP